MSDSGEFPAMVWHEFQGSVHLQRISFDVRYKYTAPTSFDIVASNDCETWTVLMQVRSQKWNLFKVDDIQQPETKEWDIPCNDLAFYKCIGVNVHNVLGVSDGRRRTAIENIKMWGIQRGPKVEVDGEWNRVRLVDGPNENSGRLEVFLNGQWGTVCDDYQEPTRYLKWGEKIARVVCKSLGFSYGKAYIRSTMGGRANDGAPTWMDHVKCVGDETSIFDCPRPRGEEPNCNRDGVHDDDLGVECECDAGVECGIISIAGWY